jgi:hypothetical protein
VPRNSDGLNDEARPTPNSQPCGCLQSLILSNLGGAASTDDDDLPPYFVDIKRSSTLSLSISERTLVCLSSEALRR